MTRWWRDPLLWGVILIAGAARAFGLTRQALWYDEVYLVSLAQLGLRGWVIPPPPHPIVGRLAKAPALVALLRPWIRIFGPSERALRSLFAFTGVAGVIPLYLVARHVRSRRVGLLAGMLLAASSFHIYFSQQVSEYGSLMLVGLLSMYLWLTGATRRAAALNVAGLLVHPLSALTSGIQIALQVTGRGSRSPGQRWAFLLNLLPLVAVSAFGAFLLVTGRNAISLGWIPPLSWGRAALTVRELTHGVMSHGGLVELDEGLPPVLTVVMVAVLGLAAVGAIHLHRGDRPALRTLMIWLLAPPAALALVSTVANVWVTRYMIIILPALLVLAAVGIDRVLGERTMSLRAAAVALPLVALAALNFQLHNRDPGQSFREAVNELRPVHPDDGVIVTPDRLTLPFGYHFDGDLPAWIRRGLAAHRRVDPEAWWLTTDSLHPEKRLEQQPGFREWLARHRRVWLVMVADWPGDAQTPSLLAFLQRHRRLTERTPPYGYSGTELLIFE